MGDIPLDTNTCANYIFPSFISHKRVRIFKTYFESSLYYCKFIINASLNKLATFQFLWDTFIEITPAPVFSPPFSFKMDDSYNKNKSNQLTSNDGVDVILCILMVSYQRYRRFVHVFKHFLAETQRRVLFTHTMYFLNVLFP